MNITEMLEKLKDDPSWCEDENVRATIAAQLKGIIIES